MKQSKSKIKGIIEAKNLTIDDKIKLLSKHKYSDSLHDSEMQETRNAIREQRKLAEERRERERKELRRLGGV
tara:strand:+ start:201 stop:416 length:216 start_codon:yes stop_codon:yes gene_type:complete